jgi:hypothetical protein
MSVSRLARVFGTVALATMCFSSQGSAHDPTAGDPNDGQ